MTLYGGIEAGGTKFICGIGNGQGELFAETRFPTTYPEETISRAIAFFQKNGPVSALGIASFGPLDLRPDSPSFGFITDTPKPGWANTDIAGPFREALGVPVGLDTDVNGAALGESLWGAAKGLDTFIYLTIGTGIGGGGMAGGRLLHGALHPEMGHIRIPHDWKRDPFEGICPFHGDCLEGLASGPAIALRWRVPGESLTASHPAWGLEAHYLALGLSAFICTLSPQRILLGGGVMNQPHLFPLVREQVQHSLNGYIKIPEITDRITDYIVPPGLGARAGLLGAVSLAFHSTLSN